MEAATCLLEKVGVSEGLYLPCEGKLALSS